jgi:hypothetical protein
MADQPDNPGAQFLERKLATILSADVAEFSRLMGENEEQTLNTFRGHTQALESLVAMPSWLSLAARLKRCDA